MKTINTVLMLALTGMATAYADGTGKQGYLGIGVDYLDSQLRAIMPQGVDEKQGILVTRFAKQSPAADEGIKQYDVLLAYDDKPITDPREFIEWIRADRPGRDVLLKVVRQGVVRTVDVTLGAQDPASAVSQNQAAIIAPPGYRPPLPGGYPVPVPVQPPANVVTATAVQPPAPVAVAPVEVAPGSFPPPNAVPDHPSVQAQPAPATAAPSAPVVTQPQVPAATQQPVAPVQQGARLPVAPQPNAITPAAPTAGQSLPAAPPGKDFDGLAIRRIQGDVYEASIGFVDANGKKVRRAWRGNRQQLLAQVMQAPGLPPATRQQLWFAIAPKQKPGGANQWFGNPMKNFTPGKWFGF